MKLQSLLRIVDILFPRFKLCWFEIEKKNRTYLQNYSLESIKLYIG